MHDESPSARPRVRFPPGAEIVRQPSSERLWKSPQWQLDYSLGEETDAAGFLSEREPAFYDLVTARVGPGGDVFVLDVGDYSVKRVSGGKVAARYGAGKGNGPGEMLGPMDLAIDAEGGVWVADPVNGAVIAFDAAGGLRTTVRQEIPPARVLVGSGDQMLIASPDGHRGMFRLTDAGETQRFGRLISEPRHAIAFDGWLAGGDGSFVYGPIYIGMLFHYDFTGRLLWVAETLDPVAPPKVVFRDDGLIVRDPQAKPVTYSLAVSAERIYTLSQVTDGGLRPQSVADVYDRKTGQYLHSFKLPTKAKGFLVDSSSLYTYTATQLRRWRLAAGEDV